MIATILVLWCVAALVLAPIVGRAIRYGQSSPAARGMVRAAERPERVSGKAAVAAKAS